MEHEVVIRLRIILDIVPSAPSRGLPLDAPWPAEGCLQGAPSPAEDYGKSAPNPVVEKMREMNAAKTEAYGVGPAMAAVAQQNADNARKKTEIIRICEPTEPAARPLRHIKKQAEASDPLPTAEYVRAKFAERWEKLGSTSVNTPRMFALLREHGANAPDNVPLERRADLLRALETFE